MSRKSKFSYEIKLKAIKKYLNGEASGSVLEHLLMINADSFTETDENDLTTGVITDETTGQVFQANGFPPFIEEIIRCGGLLKYLKARQAEQGESV